MLLIRCLAGFWLDGTDDVCVLVLRDAGLVEYITELEHVVVFEDSSLDIDRSGGTFLNLLLQCARSFDQERLSPEDPSISRTEKWFLNIKDVHDWWVGLNRDLDDFRKIIWTTTIGELEGPHSSGHICVVRSSESRTHLLEGSNIDVC